MVASLNELGLHSICMIKKNLKFSFVGETRALSLKKIPMFHNSCDSEDLKLFKIRNRGK